MTTNSTDSASSPTTYSRGADGTLHVAGRVVVDTENVRIIDELLPGAGHTVETIPELRLSLLAFEDIDAAIAALPEPTGRYASLRGADPVEELMARIRAEASRREPSRVPQMGKDRVVLGGEGWPYFSPKDPTLAGRAASGPYPDPLSAPRSLRADDTSTGDAAQGVTDRRSAAGNGDDGCTVVVGILDSPVVVKGQPFESVTHLHSGSELAPDALKLAWQGHGTFVTGLVHAQAPQAQIHVLAVLVDNGFATAWEAAKGMVELKTSGVHVINMSIGCVTGDYQPPFALSRAVDDLSASVVLVAAAGNRDPNTQGSTPPDWPAALPGVLSVGSITDQGVSSPFSPQEPWVAVAAVGENVRSTFITGDVACGLDGGGSRKRRFWGTAIWSGTSFAAATVTGRLADLACKRGGPPAKTVRELADKLPTGELADDVVRQA